MRRIVVLITLLFALSNAFGQRFFGADYRYVTFSDEPSVDDYSLKGANMGYSIFQADASLPIFLDKKKENSLLLTTLRYTTISPNVDISKKEKQRFEEKIPKYYYKFPQTHSLALEMTFIQNITEKWEFLLNYTLMMTTNEFDKMSGDDFNNAAFFLVNRKIGKFEVGLGATFYLIDGELNALPLGNFAYEGEKLKLEIIAPLALNANFKLTEKSSLVLDGDLEFGGYRLHNFGKDVVLNKNADYSETTSLSLAFKYDRNFYKNLHWNIGVGHMYHSINFKNKEKELSELSLQEGFQLCFGFYSTF